MKCRSCHANLSIEDEKCPYCGTPNPEAIRHRQDMHRFSGEFHQTKSSVLKTSAETAQKYFRIIIICVLSVLVLISFFVLGNSWNITSAIQDAQAIKNYQEYSALLDQYEAEDNALAFTALYENHYLYGVDKYEGYQHYYRAASSYTYVYYEILDYLEEEDPEYAPKLLEHIFDYLDSYYSYLEQEHYDFYMDTGMYDEVHLQAVDRLTVKLEALLQYAFSLSDEEMESFSQLSSAEKQVLMERKVKENE